MAPWTDDVAVPEREVLTDRPHVQTGAKTEDSGSRSGTAVRWAEDPFYDQYEHVNLDAKPAVRCAMPDHQGLGPAWQRRLDDRDPLDDRLTDERRADEGWRAVPMLEDGYW